MRYHFIITIAILFTSCTTSLSLVTGGGGMELEPVTFTAIPGWDSDNHNEALGAFLKSCSAIAKQDDNETIGQGQLQAPAATWKTICRRATTLASSDASYARAFFEESFTPYRVTQGHNASGLFTGYYEPLLMGSLSYHPPFIYPIYSLPLEGAPTYTRMQIDQGALNGQVPAIAFVDDPVQLFFLQVQGSGRIQLEDGKFLHVGYAGTNGQKYVAIGKVLADKGYLKKKDISMPAIREWLDEHPSDKWQIMWENPSYIYFREIEGDPVGAERAVLTGGRSMAVDAQYIPLGMPLFIDTILPASPAAPVTLYRRLMIAQDTGSAIHGVVRGDIFFGFGPAAEQYAGHMKSGGEYIALVPRAIASSLAQP
jgi:membrane-bound lytic murein transglycosylase A